jgi:hypothetical protein
MTSKQIPTSKTYVTTGITIVNNKGDLFIDLVPSMINLLSAGDSYISNLLINNDENYSSPSFFQLPFIVSIIDNVNSGNYSFTTSTNNNLVTSIYSIPYKGLINDNIATFITFYNTELNLLKYIIPRELTYQSKDEAYVYATKSNNKYNIYLIIPNSFYNSSLNFKYNDGLSDVGMDMVIDGDFISGLRYNARGLKYDDWI